MKSSWSKPFLMGVTVGWFFNGFITNISRTNSYINTTSDYASALHGVQNAHTDLGKGDTQDDGKDIDKERLDELCNGIRHGTNITDVVMEEETGDENRENERKQEETMELEGEGMEREQQQQQQPTSVCSAIHSLPSSSPMSIWKRYLMEERAGSIFWASKHVTEYTQS